MLRPDQCRAARAFLDWSQTDLATAAHLGLSTIRDFEKGRRLPAHNNLLAIKLALEHAGIIFLSADGEGPGVRLRIEGAPRDTKARG